MFCLTTLGNKGNPNTKGPSLGYFAATPIAEVGVCGTGGDCLLVFQGIVLDYKSLYFHLQMSTYLGQEQEQFRRSL